MICKCVAQIKQIVANLYFIFFKLIVLMVNSLSDNNDFLETVVLPRPFILRFKTKYYASETNNIVCDNPANTRRSSNASSMLGQRRRRWATIKPAPGETLIFAG